MTDEDPTEAELSEQAQVRRTKRERLIESGAGACFMGSGVGVFMSVVVMPPARRSGP